MSLISKGNNTPPSLEEQYHQHLVQKNQEQFDRIISQDGVGKATTKKLQEILEYCNENNLTLEEGETSFTNGTALCAIRFNMR